MNTPAAPHDGLSLHRERLSLCEALDRVLNKGVVVAAEISISVADIDLIYVELRALITSVETARRLHDASGIAKTRSGYGL